MTLLIFGLCLFLIPHQLKAYAPGLRSTLLTRLGENAFNGIYSLIAALGLFLIIVGYRAADYVWLWQPLPGSPVVTHALMLFAVALLIAPKLPNSWGKVVQHPMLLGTMLWAIAHLWSNGHLKALLLFGGFFIYALSNAWQQDWHKPINAVPLWKNILWLLVSVLAYGVIRYIHVLIAK